MKFAKCRTALLAATAALWAIAVGQIVYAHDYSAPHMYLLGIYSNGGRDYPPASYDEMSWLLKQLQSDDENIRAVAAGALGQTKDKRAVEPLLKALKDESGMVKEDAAGAFVHIQDPRSIELLKAMMTDEEANYNPMTAGYALAAQGDKGLEALEDAANSLQQKAGVDSEKSGEYLVEMLSIAKGEGAIEWAIEKLKSSDKKWQGTALSMLMRLGESDSKALKELLKDQPLANALLNIALSSDAGIEPQEGEPFNVALAMLSNIDPSKNTEVADKIFKAAQDKNRKNSRAFLSVLKEMGDSRASLIPAPAVAKMASATIKSLIKEIEKASENDIERTTCSSYRAAVKLCESDDPKAIAALAGVLNSKNSDAADLALTILDESDNPLAVDALLNAVKTVKGNMRSYISLRLAYKRDPKVVPYLISLIHDKVDDIRTRAIETLGEIGDRRATKPLTSLINDKGDGLYAITALCEIKDPEATGALIPLLKNEKTGASADEYGKDRLIKGLAAFGPSIIPTLTPRLKDTSVYMRLHVVEILGEIRHADTIASLVSAASDASPKVRKAAITVLEDADDDRARKTIFNALNDKNKWVKQQAAYAALKHPIPDWKNTFADLLKDKDQEVRACAAISLGELGDSRGANAAIKALDGSFDYSNGQLLWLPAIRAAGKLKDKRAIESILNSFSEDISMSVFDGVSEDQHDIYRSTKLEALKSITGQDFGNAYYRWMAWWIAQGHNPNPGSEEPM